MDVRWADPALSDLEAIVAFLRTRSPRAAERVVTRVDAKVGALSKFPNRGRIVPELQRIGITKIRELILKPYRLLYEIDAKGVLIVAVFDARRDLEEAIFARLLDV